MTRTKQPVVNDDVLSSWILFALRKVFGYEDIRNMILKKLIKDKKEIVFGKTFGAENTETQLKTYLKKIVKSKTKKKYLLFTASNQAFEGETHYQTFVVDYDKKHLWVIDPASKMGKEGIYSAYVATDTIMPFFREKGWEARFVELRNACQTTLDDIFCQTWSLWLQSKFIHLLLEGKKSLVISIPKPLTTRYKDLLKFYQECLQIPSVCRELKVTYQETIQTSPELVKGLDKQTRTKLIQHYLSFDPCRQIKDMNEYDLMTEEQRNNL